MLNDINGYTRTCGLIGNPVEHTLSPVIHNTLSMVLGRESGICPVPCGERKTGGCCKGSLCAESAGFKCDGSL